MIDPFNWYWLADDSRVYGSAKQTIVTDTDPDYVAWTDAGGVATIWPSDEAGNQTDAALQEVLMPYNLWVDLKAYAANVRYNHASGGVIITSLSPVAFLSDPISRNTVDSAFSYLTANASATIQWKMSDGSWITVDKAKVTTMNNDIATFIHNCFDCESTTVSGIDGGTITTQQQIDAAFAAISNVFP
jgi:hypothetical protein